MKALKYIFTFIAGVATGVAAYFGFDQVRQLRNFKLTLTDDDTLEEEE